MIESHFEITVSKNGMFYFKINKGATYALCEELQCVYPIEEGYRICMTWVECTGQFVWDNGKEASS